MKDETNELKIIDQREVLEREFRIYGTVENPLFLAKDVAEWIGHNKPSELIRNVDKDEKLLAIISHSGQNREMWLLTEDGLYEVLMQSRKPIAKEFKKKVKEILKDIRKTGGHVSNEELFLNTYLPFADEQTRTLFKGTLETVRKQNEMIQQQQKEIEYKEDVIIGLVDEITLAEKRQVLNRVVRMGGRDNIAQRWNELYRQFEDKYHINVKKRLERYNEEHKPKLKNKLDYIDKVLNKIPEIYEIACKLYENDVEKLVKEIYNLQGNK